MSLRLESIGLALAFCVSTRAVAQAVIHVPADQPTIQKGIDAATPGDTVQVAAGTWHENLVGTKAIPVVSSAGAATTIVDGGGLGPVIEFNGSSADGAILDGFTLTH